MLSALLAVGILAAGCGGGASSGVEGPTTSTPVIGGASTGTVWLCRPGTTPDPCAGNIDWTSVSASGQATRHRAAVPADPPFDCFYLYPTVSTEAGANADLRVQPAETKVAVEQAARFSAECRVWAPMYRQRTLSRIQRLLTADDPGPSQIAYSSALAAWRDYLAHDNHGRPVIFIGHSQGAIVLTQLIASQVDGDPALLSRVVSAVLLGGNVTTGSFEHIPPCRTSSAIGCVVAYSSFAGVPPANSLFGVPGRGVGVPPGAPGAGQGQPVLCVNPAAPAGGPAPLDTFVATVSGSSATWYEYPGRYVASCTTSGGVDWLQVTPDGSGDVRPTFPQTLGPRWGLHLYDVNLSLGNLVALVADQEAAYGAAHR